MSFDRLPQGCNTGLRVQRVTCNPLSNPDQLPLALRVQLALQAVLDYEPPDGGRMSAVSYSWGLDERNTDPNEMEGCDKLMKALLDKV